MVLIKLYNLSSECIMGNGEIEISMVGTAFYINYILK